MLQRLRTAFRQSVLPEVLDAALGVCPTNRTAQSFLLPHASQLDRTALTRPRTFSSPAYAAASGSMTSSLTSAPSAYCRNFSPAVVSDAMLET